MANEITEPGQIVTYGGPQLTLKGSDLANKVTSILAREGSGNNRAWKIFDPAKSDFLNTKKVISLGDILLINAKVLPMDFTILTQQSDSGSKELPLFSGPANETVTEFIEEYFFDKKVNTTTVFTNGTGYFEVSFDSGTTWQAIPVSIDANNGFKVRVQHPNNLAFTAKLTLSF